MQINNVGDRSLLIDLDSLAEVHRVWRALRRARPEGTEEVIAGARTVLVTFSEASEATAAAASIGSIPTDEGDAVKPNRVVIPVAYGGSDTEDVASISHLRAEQVADRHARRDYSVAFLGFSPGFAYLTGGDPALRVPRLRTPRHTVLAGSVALASEFTAVYPQSTPGGWRIIGRTDVAMFDPLRREPSLLSVGDTVRFEPVDSVGPPPDWPTFDSVAVGSNYVRVLEPGPMTTIQDGGRVGWGHLGVPRAGAADRRSADLANHLVGNDGAVALLESTMSGPHLRLGSDRVVAVTGARATLTVDGMPARLDTPLSLRAGCELRVGRHEAGARIYISFSGGIAVQPVLGSSSTDTLSGLGPVALQAGDVLPLDDDEVSIPETVKAPDATPTPTPRPGDLVTVDAVRGPREAWIGAAGMEVLAGSVFEVAATSDRTGLRLVGPAVEAETARELPSEGMVAGAIQVPPGGSPIVLLRNHPTTGGYPVAAVVTDEGVDLLSQCPPGVRVRLRIS